MWNQIDQCTVVNSDGYKIISRGLTTYYHERDRVVEFVMDPGGEKWVILLKKVAWNIPYNHESIDETRKQQIRLRTVEGLRFMNAFCEYDFEH